MFFVVFFFMIRTMRKLEMKKTLHSALFCLSLGVSVLGDRKETSL